MIPNKNPETLEDCLDILTNFKYKAAGMEAFMLYHTDFSLMRGWSCCYRNAMNFENPKISERTPIEACWKMLEFLRTLKLNNSNNGSSYI